MQDDAEARAARDDRTRHDFPVVGLICRPAAGYILHRYSLNPA
jgi:hypothetical protein